MAIINEDDCRALLKKALGFSKLMNARSALAVQIQEISVMRVTPYLRAAL